VVAQLLEEEGCGGLSIKLGDFGFATVLGDEEMMKYYCGTPLKMAPEVLNDKFYCHSADVYSLGVSVFEAIFGQTPFIGTDKPDLIKNVNNGMANIPTNVHASRSCLDFLSKCLMYDPDSRISVDHCLNHPFINSNSPKYIE
jgi:serine/threonine protein kinase